MRCDGDAASSNSPLSMRWLFDVMRHPCRKQFYFYAPDIPLERRNSHSGGDATQRELRTHPTRRRLNRETRRDNSPVTKSQRIDLSCQLCLRQNFPPNSANALRSCCVALPEYGASARTATAPARTGI